MHIIFQRMFIIMYFNIYTSFRVIGSLKIIHLTMIDKEKAITPIKSLRTSAHYVQILLPVIDPLIIANSFEKFWHFLLF